MGDDAAGLYLNVVVPDPQRPTLHRSYALAEPHGPLPGVQRSRTVIHAEFGAADHTRSTEFTTAARVRLLFLDIGASFGSKSSHSSNSSQLVVRLVHEVRFEPEHSQRPRCANSIVALQRGYDLEAQATVRCGSTTEASELAAEITAAGGSISAKVLSKLQAMSGGGTLDFSVQGRGCVPKVGALAFAWPQNPAEAPGAFANFVNSLASMDVAPNPVVVSAKLALGTLPRGAAALDFMRIEAFAPRLSRVFGVLADEARQGRNPAAARSRYEFAREAALRCVDLLEAGEAIDQALEELTQAISAAEMAVGMALALDTDRVEFLGTEAVTNASVELNHPYGSGVVVSGGRKR